MPILRKHVDRHFHFEGMMAFYINATMRALVFALVGIFTPIFIYKEVLAVSNNVNGLLAVLGYYLIVRVTVLLITIPVAKIIEKLGFRWSVLTSVVFLGISLMALFFASGGLGWFLVAAVVSGVNIPFYWVSRNSAISQDSKSSTIGKQVGMLTVFERVAGMLGPFVGGEVIELWGFSTLYGLAFAILLLSVIPLFSMPHHIHRNGVSLHGFVMWIKGRQFFHQAVATVGRSFDDYSGSVVWPLVIFLFGTRLGTVGMVFSFLTALAVAVRYLSGLLFDRLYKKGGMEDERLFGLVAVGQSITWILRIFASSVVHVLWIDGVGTLFGTTYRNISDDYKYLGGKRMSEIAYFAYIELMYSIGVIVFVSLGMIGIYLGIWKEILFTVTSLWVLVSIVQARESDLR